MRLSQMRPGLVVTLPSSSLRHTRRGSGRGSSRLAGYTAHSPAGYRPRCPRSCGASPARRRWEQRWGRERPTPLPGPNRRLPSEPERQCQRPLASQGSTSGPNWRLRWGVPGACGGQAGRRGSLTVDPDRRATVCPRSARVPARGAVLPIALRALPNPVTVAAKHGTRRVVARVARCHCDPRIVHPTPTPAGAPTPWGRPKALLPATASQPSRRATRQAR